MMNELNGWRRRSSLPCGCTMSYGRQPGQPALLVPCLWCLQLFICCELERHIARRWKLRRRRGLGRCSRRANERARHHTLHLHPNNTPG